MFVIKQKGFENLQKTMSENSIFNTNYHSQEVNIGGLKLGGENPVRIQSMTSTNTLDTKATVEQSIRMIEAGSEYVRITTPGLKDVENLKIIQSELVQKGFETPLIADIHFNSKAAELAAQFIAKVRINPGNYIAFKSSEKAESFQASDSSELEKIASNIFPLIEICKKNDTAIRIGTNHGSLSQRILSTYGNTPLGMVESAMEFVKICQSFDFHKIILSMKSSNLKVMVHAYRMLVDRLIKEGMTYPLHLGVTEAGNGVEGRIKSAIGIGTLLQEGIGDTIRVSLTEDPENELPVARQIIKHSRTAKNRLFFESIPPFEFNKRSSNSVYNIGGRNVPIVISDVSSEASDFVFDSSKNILVGTNYQFKIGKINDDFDGFLVELGNLKTDFKKFHEISHDKILILACKATVDLFELKSFFAELIQQKIKNPIVLQMDYREVPVGDLIYKASITLGSLFVDGLVDGLWLQVPETFDGVDLSFKILQASGVRISSTEFIACPSCGRTLFNIQEAFEKVKEATNHLIGLKIAVMGCVVNGPGEMADADYGYVGAGKGKVNLYKSHELIKRGVDEKVAIKALIQLIKDNGEWVNQ